MISKRKQKKIDQAKRAQTWGTPEFLESIKKHDKKSDKERDKNKALKYIKKRAHKK